MNELMIFENTDFGKIRTTMIDDEPWFVGKDVCEVFGDTNHHRSLNRIDKEDKSTEYFKTPGGIQEMTIINESGFYTLMFQMQPQKARGVSQTVPPLEERISKLRMFKRWVTSEVLPTLRKTGQYSMKNPSREETIKVAEIIAKCPNTRLPIVLDILSKAGFDFDEADTSSDTEFMDLLNQFSLPQLINILGLPKSTLHYYRTGQHHPQPDRRRFIVNTLKDVM